MICLLMTTITDQTAATIAVSRKLTRTSSCGKWESFLNHAGLMRYVPSGEFYARCKVMEDGKAIIRKEKLLTTIKGAAVTLLPAKLAELRKPKTENNISVVSIGREKFLTETESQHDLSEGTRRHRRECVKALLRTWDGLDGIMASDITEADCQKWAKTYANQYAAPQFNNTLSYLRRILELCGLPKEANPAFKVHRRGNKPTQLHLPSTDQLNTILSLIETSKKPGGKDRADFLRFLIFTGCRHAEAKLAKWSDVNFERKELLVHGVKGRKRNGHSNERIVPMSGPLITLLQGWHPHRTDDAAPICKTLVCIKPLRRACAIMNIAPSLTHHDFRHFFATMCIEAGVDIPTVARWLGHKDGGILAIKVYGHFRNEHSQAMARKVNPGIELAPLPKQLETVTV